MLKVHIMLFWNVHYIGSFQKTSIPPPQRKLEVNPPTPFGCPNTFTIIRNNFVSPPPPDGRNFLCGGSVYLFWNDPFAIILNYTTIFIKYLCHFPINWRRVHQKPNTSRVQFHPRVGNFAHKFCPEGVEFDIFYVKMSNPHPFPDLPTPPSGLT
jgi:hypothetical protein